MKELIALLAGNFEADETQAFTRDNGLVTLGTEDVLPEFHKSPHETYCSFLQDRAADRHFQILASSPRVLSCESRAGEEQFSQSGSPHAPVSFGQPSSY